MYTTSFVAAAGAALAAVVSAQSTGPMTAAPGAGISTTLSPNQSSVISRALVSYAGSLINERDVQQLGIGLALNGVKVNAETIAQLNPVPTSSGVDWVSFVNNPPSITATPTWLATMPAETKTSVSSIQASALNRAVNIVRAQLSLPSTTIAAVASQTSDGAGGTNAAVPARLGAAEGMLGAAAVGVGLVAAAL